MNFPTTTVASETGAVRRLSIDPVFRSSERRRIEMTDETIIRKIHWKTFVKKSDIIAVDEVSGAFRAFTRTHEDRAAHEEEGRQDDVGERADEVRQELPLDDRDERPHFGPSVTAASRRSGPLPRESSRLVLRSRLLARDEPDEDVLEGRLPRGHLEERPAAGDDLPEDGLAEVGTLRRLEKDARLAGRADPRGVGDARDLPERDVRLGDLPLQDDAEPRMSATSPAGASPASPARRSFRGR